MINNENNNFEFLDIINIAGFLLQVQNIMGDDKYHAHLLDEIKKLHEEHNEIIQLLKSKEGANGAE